MKSSCLRPLAALLLTVGLAACGGKASYDVSGTISGLNNAGLVLANGGDTVSPPVGATTFTFPKRIDYGTDYNITVKTPPAHMNCAVSGGTGSAGRYVSIQAAVNCQQNVYTVGGTISGQTVDGLVLGNGSTATQLTVAKATATFTMPDPGGRWQFLRYQRHHQPGRSDLHGGNQSGYRPVERRGHHGRSEHHQRQHRLHHAT